MQSQITDFEFSKGVAWLAGIRIKRQANPGRKAILQLAHPNGSPAVTIGLTDLNAFTLWVIDAYGNEHSLTPIPNTRFADIFTTASAEVIPIGEERLKLRVQIGEFVSQSVVAALLVGSAVVRSTLGSFEDGFDPVSFDMGGMLLFNDVLTDEDRDQIFSEMRRVFKIDQP